VLKEVEALKSERDALQLALNTKVTELKNDLAVAMDDNETLMEKMKDASDDLEAKQTQMESLEHDKSEALAQLKLTQEKSNANLKSFKLQEETLIEKMKSDAAQQRVSQECDVLKEVEALKSERDALQLALNTKVTELKNDLAVAMDDNETLMEKMKDASDDLEAKQTQMESLEHDKSEALAQLKLTQDKSNADLESFKLQEETLRAETAKGDDAVGSLQGRVDAADEELRKITAEHIKSTTALSTKITELQNGLGVATYENALLVKKMKDASDDLKAKTNHLESLEHANNEALKHLCLSQQKDESFKVQEENLRAEIKKADKMVSSLLAEKDRATARNISLSGVMGALKVDQDTLQQRLNSSRGRVARLEGDLAESHRQLEHANQHEASRVNNEVRGLKSENERLRAERRHLTNDFDDCCQKMDDLSNELSGLQRQLKGAKEDEARAEGRLVKSEQEKLEIAHDSNAANAKIKELFARVQNTKKELNFLQKANVTLKGRDRELRESIARIQELVEALSSENADLKEKNESFGRARECLENRSRELQCLVSTVTSERDSAYNEMKNLMSKFKRLSNERDTAIREKENFRMKLDKLASDFEADYETVRSKIDTLLTEKKDLRGKITFLEASKASVEDNADRILERDNAIAVQHDRLKSSFKKQTMRIAELQDEVNQVVMRLTRFKAENGRLARDNCALKDIIQISSEARSDDPNNKKRTILGFRANK